MQNVGVKALIEGLSGYVSGAAQMEKANAAVGKSADGAAAAVARQNVALDTSSSKFRKIGSDIQESSLFAGKALLAVELGAAGLAAAFVAATVRAAEFEHAMAGIAAVSGANAEQMKQLSEAALTAGKAFGFTATETAGAEEALIKAGVSISDVLGGALPAALTLAAAGSISVTEAAEIGANALNQFSLKGSDMAHVADLIAGAANASAIDVKDFGLSLQQAGAVAATAGQTLDSTSQAIAVLGSAGIKSSDAGTSLKTMLMNLQPQSKNAAELMQFLGLVTKDGANQFFDAEGKVKSFKDIAGVLNVALRDLTQQQRLATLSIIFGSDAARAAAIFAREGAAGFDEMAASMAKVSAEDVAGKRLDSLEGDLKKLKVALDGVATTAGTQTTPALREATQALIELTERVGPAAVGVGSILAEAFLRGAQLAVILADGARQAASALGMLQQQGMSAGRTAAYGVDDPARTRFGALQDFSSLERSIDDLHGVGMAAAKASPQVLGLRSNLDDLLHSFVSGGGGGGGGKGVKGAAEEAKTALQEFGISLDDIRKAGEAAKLSQDVIDAAILKVGGTALDTGPILEGYGKTVTRMAAAWNAAGLDGAALVATIQQQAAAAKAQVEAEKAAAKAEKERQEEERRAEEAARKAEEAARKAAEEAKRARDAVVSGIVGAATRDTLGGARGRAPKDAAQAAADFSAAASGLGALAKAGLDTDVALDLMERRLGNLAGQFAALTGDDLASAGATTDGIRKLIQAFRDGTIGVEEFDAGMSKFTGELGRLGGVVDDTAAKFRKFDEDNAARVKGDTLAAATDRATDALRLQREELDHGLGPAWARVGKTMSQMTKEFEENIARQRQKVDELLVQLSIINGRVNEDMESGNRARAAADRFGQSLKEGMTTADIGAALREALAGGGRLDNTFQLVFFGAIQEALMRAGVTIAPGIGESLAGTIAKALGIGGGLESFGSGGIVGGPYGAPRMIMAHGGEQVVPRRPDLVMLPPSGGAGGGAVDRSVTYNLTANYTRPETPQSIRYELQTLAMLAGT